MPEIPINEWLPDQMALDNAGNVNVSNVLPLTTRTYGPIGTLSAATSALAATCMGAGFFRGIGGTILNCAGTSVKLYKLASGAWSNITRSSAVDYAVQTDDMWAFTQFGDRVIAVNGTDAAQYYDIGSSTNFEPLAGSPPVGRYVASVRDFVFIGRIASAANKLQWSGFNNSANWTIGTNQSDDAEIPTGGKITGIVGGEYATVFSEESINRFTYVGSPIIFQRDTISIMSGTACENSIAVHQGLIFYVSYDGFFMLDRSGSQTPIGRYVAAVRDFVFIGRIASAANKLQWSGFNNSANWTIGTNQSDDAEIPTGNKIMGIVGGEYATVFSEEAINRFTYVGTPIIFQRDNISVMSGTACENSIVGHQGLIFYVSYDGFFMLDRSGSQTPIGDQKVDRFFWSNVNQSYL